MNKNIIIIILVIIAIVIGVYFVFIKQSPAPAHPSTGSGQATPTPTASQPQQTGPAVFTDPSDFAPNFLQCNTSEFKTQFPGPNALFVISVLGVESGNCHYTVKVVDQNSGLVIPGGPPVIDCKVPKQLINEDVLNHLFGSDKTPAIKAAQDKIEADYCTNK